MARHEQQPHTTGETLPERHDQQELTAAHERLSEQREQQAERDKQRETSPDGARREALEQAGRTERKQATGTAHEAAPETHRPLGRKHTDASFQHTMTTVQRQLSGPSRTFSKVIHNKAVERTSEAVGATIARPNAVLAGSMAAFIVTLAIYLIAKRYGYALSGFETIAAFIGGWCIGILIDFFRVMITGKRS